MACRTGELQALSSDVGWGDRGSFVSLRFVPEFWAKTESLGKPVRRSFRVRALSSYTKDKDELLLCPVRALRYYLRHLRHLKLTPERLFVAPSFPSRMISKNSASFFIKSVILDSHKPVNLPPDVQLWKLGKVRAYDLRGYSVSHAAKLAGTLEVVRDAKIWRCDTTFTRFYLKGISLWYKDRGYFALQNDLRVLAQSVVSESRGLLEPPGPVVVDTPSGSTPSGSREPKDLRSKVKSSARSCPSQRSSSPALFSTFDKLGGEGVVKH